MRIFVKTIIIMFVILFVVSGTVLAEENDGGDDDWELHCTLGIVCLILVVIILVTGVLLSGRFGRIKGLKSYPIHFLLTIILSLFLTGQFLYGLTNAQWEYTFDIHGIVALLIPVVAWLTTIMSPCIAGKVINRKASSRIHVMLAIVLLAIVFFQVYYAYVVLGE